MNATHKTEVKNQQISIEIEKEAGDFHAPGNKLLIVSMSAFLRWLCTYIYVSIYIYIYIYIVVLLTSVNNLYDSATKKSRRRSKMKNDDRTYRSKNQISDLARDRDREMNE